MSDLLDPKKNLSEEEILEKFLIPTYSEILSQKKLRIEATLHAAIDDFNNVSLAESAKKFRKIAADLKLIDLLITDKGNHSERNSLNDLSGKQWIQHTKSWLVVDGSPGSITKEIKDHPASFPPSLAEFFISYFTKQNQWVFDPFMGIGSTVEACYTTKRNCFGIELNPKYAQFAQNRIAKLQLKNSNHQNSHNSQKEYNWKIFADDCRNAKQIWNDQKFPPMDFLITSPPYWNMLKKSRGGVKSSLKQRVEEGFDEYYSENSKDFGNIDDIEGYLTALSLSFSNFKPILKKGAYLMIILQNCRPKDGVMQPIAWDFANKLKEHYTLRQEYIWCQDQKFAGIWGYPTTYVSNVHHHYCLVFQNL